MLVEDVETRMSLREFVQWTEWYALKQEAADEAARDAKAPTRSVRR